MGKWKQEEINKAISLLKLGKQYNEIGDELGRSRDSIRNKLAKLGVNYETFNPKVSVKCGDDEKYCGTCENVKLKFEFNKNKTNKDGLNTICRECSNKRSREYYNENKEYHINEIGKRNKRLLKKQREKIFNYLKSNPCVDCGLSDPIVLEFDHRDGVDKKHNISKMIGSYSWNTILNEIDKCDVRCANCHRIRTAKQFNWYQGLI